MKNGTSIAIGVLGFDNVNALDIVGPLEAFAEANGLAASQGLTPPYQLMVLGLSTQAFVSESGITFVPRHSIATVPALDTLIIPGGRGLREPAINTEVATWLRERAPAFRRIASVCTGIYGLAPTGLLDGRRVTTHWRFAPAVAQRFPLLKVDPDAIFIRDECFYTSAGITAGIDLALALIEEDCGRPLSLAVARELVVYLRRAGGQEQYSEPLQRQSRGGDRFGELCAWISGHLSQPLTVETLAERVCLSTRQFSRNFAAQFGCPPAEFVEDLRLREARRLLDEAALDIESIAAAVGFRSADVFRRAFERRFGLLPSAYRLRFGTTRENAPATSAALPA